MKARVVVKAKVAADLRLKKSVVNVPEEAVEEMLSIEDMGRLEKK